ncbi:hypothetical protein [Streptomyces sp. NPDC057336]|uniref:hypothetical protein n=1 Tax=Streptomyces sp. NPDC057336 TaxID=3346102 RepID=UPI0036292BE8
MSGYDQTPSPDGDAWMTASPPPGAGAPARKALRPWQWTVLGVVAGLLAAALGTATYALRDTTAKGDTPAGAGLLYALTPGAAEARYGIEPPSWDEPTVMKGWDFGVKITGHGEIERFVRDGTRYGPAAGHRLYTLALTGIDGEQIGSRSRGTTLTVRFGQGERPLKDADSLAEGERRVLLVSVPDSAVTADLVLAEDDLTQTVSLTTGAPDPSNPEVLAREDVTSGPMLRTGTLDYRVSSSAASLTLARTAHYRLTSARLSYRHLYRQDEHAAQDSAFLFLTGTMKRTSKTRGLPPEWISLRLPDGTTRTAGTYSDHRNYRWLAIEVPGDFTHGTLVFSGSDRFPGTDNPQGVTLTVETEREERLTMVGEPAPDAARGEQA